MDIGIDLGTTFSVLAVNGRVGLTPDYPPGVYLDDCDVTIIPTPYGDATFPSVMWEDPENPGRCIFGADALQKAEDGSAPVMFSKRKIGTREAIPLNGQTIFAKDVAREFLRHLKECAEQALGSPVTRAVVTHPAYFDRGAVEETRLAAQEAGFDVSLPDQMLMEPVAAALAYTRTDKRDPLRVLTYDLGGGTFDVTYLQRSGGVIEMKAFDGDHLLGGYNFDRELLHWVRKRLEAQGRRIVLDEDDPEDRGRLARLLRVAENVKIALADARTDQTMIDFRALNIALDTDGRPIQINERISRQQFVELIRPHLDRTVECCKRALAKAHADVSEVDEALLVGGSTYGPWIVESLAVALPGVTPKLFYPDLCVGVGAAIHAKMILPPVVGGDDYRLLLEVPETTAIDVINIGGQVTNADGSPVSRALSVTLRLPDASVAGPEMLNEDGRFLFTNTELQDDGPGNFILSVAGESGVTILEHRFAVDYAPETAETSGVTTVLPKPLFVQTLEGLVPLAEEGLALPSRCEQTFQRENDNPNISLKLFQEQDPIGEIRIEDIPPEGGRGAFVDLVVEITEKNQIRGKARVRTRLGQVVAESDVRVRFETPDVPSPNELAYIFEEAKGAWTTLLVSDDARLAETMEPQVTALIRQIERLFEQQPLERQEIHVALRQLHRLLTPPEDEMNPSLREFSEVVGRCRIAIDEMAEKARQTLHEANGGADSDGMQSSAERNLRKSGHYREAVDRIEHEGQSAHERRDRKSWARLYDALTDIEVQVRDRRRPEDLPTVILKMLASFEVMRFVGSLEEEEQKLANKGRLQDWRAEIHRIRTSLDAAMQQLDGINDGLPSDQGRAQIRLVFTRVVQPAKQAIDRLGVDVSKTRPK